MTPDKRSPAPQLTSGLITLLAFACGAMVANIYYAQTLIGKIGPEIGLSPALSGVIVTLTQLGYGLGLFLLVPLGDLYENRRLSLLMIGGTCLGCLAIALSRGPVTFLVASLVTGVAATGAQILLPLASHLSAPERQGRTIGQIMSGLLAGIMLARPLASFIAESFGWRAVFYLSAALMAATGAALAATLPARAPRGALSYPAILRSMVTLTRRHRRLRLRALYQAALFAAFNLFWTAAPLVLIRKFHLTQNGVALFALAGAGGALAAPLAGWMADHGKTRIATLLAHLVLVGGFIAAGFVAAAGLVIVLGLIGFLIDAAVQLNQITGQKIIFEISQEARSRVNSIYLTSIFAIGAMGSVLGSFCFERGGWGVTAAVGAAIGGASLLVVLLFDRPTDHTPASGPSL
ncbi:MAG: MFS transporter [Verrucomicrobiota bacterium]|nr:MFS transporter [Verrucomicrobiota bacterium]